MSLAMPSVEVQHCFSFLKFDLIIDSGLVKFIKSVALLGPSPAAASEELRPGDILDGKTPRNAREPTDWEQSYLFQG